MKRQTWLIDETEHENGSRKMRRRRKAQPFRSEELSDDDLMLGDYFPGHRIHRMHIK